VPEPGIEQAVGGEGFPSIEELSRPSLTRGWYITPFGPQTISAVSEEAATVPAIEESAPATAAEFVQVPEAIISAPAPPAPEEIAAVQVRQALAVQTLAQEGPDWWNNLKLVTKAAEQPALISPEEYDQRVAVEQAQQDRAKYLDQQLAEQMKTPDHKVFEWLGQQPPVPENLDSQLQGLPLPRSEPLAPTNKRKLVASGITSMVDSLAKDGKLPMLANRLNSIITGVSSVRPQDDGRVVAIVAKAKLDPEIMSSVIADISRRMTQRVPGMIPFGSLGPLPELVRL
jgi:hypothetical protein